MLDMLVLASVPNNVTYSKKNHSKLLSKIGPILTDIYFDLVLILFLERQKMGWPCGVCLVMGQKHHQLYQRFFQSSKSRVPSTT